LKELPYLVTFPRSGSHYFDEIIYKETGINIEKSHAVNELFDERNQKKRKIITIVRDPKDSIISYRANEQKYFKAEPIRQKVRTHQVLSEYILLHNFLYEHADHIIDFNDLTSHPDAVVKKILKELGIDEKDYTNSVRVEIKYDEEYVPSSKELASYNENILDDFDMSLCYFYYNKILEKKIVI